MLRKPKYPELKSHWVSKSSGDLVEVIDQTRAEHRTGRWAWTAIVKYKFLTGPMVWKTGTASLSEFRSFFYEKYPIANRI